MVKEFQFKRISLRI